ncbi:MAG TPA: hypothetical protein VJT50_12125 [Pyrinomonadaceae bacterium]|nr:hypothetical protein [Pyrinomonadaceae bacterium]
MVREQTRNIEIARIGAAEINEFEYQKHQGEMTEQEHGEQQRRGAKRQTRAQRIAEVTAAAHKTVEKRRKKQGAKPGTTKTTKAAKKGQPSGKRAKSAPAKRTTKTKKK